MHHTQSTPISVPQILPEIEDRSGLFKVQIESVDYRTSQSGNPMFDIGLRCLDFDRLIHFYVVIGPIPDNRLVTLLTYLGYTDAASGYAYARDHNFDMNQLIGHTIKVRTGFNGWVESFHRI